MCKGFGDAHAGVKLQHGTNHQLIGNGGFGRLLLHVRSHVQCPSRNGTEAFALCGTRKAPYEVWCFSSLVLESSSQ